MQTMWKIQKQVRKRGKPANERRKKAGSRSNQQANNKKGSEKWKMKNNCSLSEQLYTHCCAVAVAAPNKRDSQPPAKDSKGYCTQTHWGSESEERTATSFLPFWHICHNWKGSDQTGVLMKMNQMGWYKGNTYGSIKNSKSATWSF